MVVLWGGCHDPSIRNTPDCAILGLEREISERDSAPIWPVENTAQGCGSDFGKKFLG